MKKIAILPLLLLLVFSSKGICQENIFTQDQISQELIENIESGASKHYIKKLPGILIQDTPEEEGIRDLFPWKPLLPIKPVPKPEEPNLDFPPFPPFKPAPENPDDAGPDFRDPPKDELEEYSNWFWKFYANRPLLGKVLLGAVLGGLLYVFLLLSKFASELSGEEHWVAAILKEPVKQFLGVWNMFFNKDSKK